MDTGALVLVMAVVVVAFVRSLVWMQRDLQDRTDAGHPVVARIGSLEISERSQWTLACVLFWGIAFPMYLIARKH